VPRYRSVSQLKEYKDCPYRYHLNRVERAWQRPAAWLPQGTAVHEAAEHWEKSGRTMALEEARSVFSSAYDREVNRMCDDTPNFNYWFRSGPYGGKADIERRYEIGLNQIAGYVEYYTDKHPEEVIWIAPDGTPAIELRFTLDLDGVEVRGFIDQVIADPTEDDGHDGQIRVRDIKTGNNPGDDLQLKVYALAIEDLAGVDILSGDYWMGGSNGKRKHGGPTKPYDLTAWSREQVTEEFHRLDEQVKAGNFPADPEPSKCRFCSVANACSFSMA